MLFAVKPIYIFKILSLKLIFHCPAKDLCLAPLILISFFHLSWSPLPCPQDTHQVIHFLPFAPNSLPSIQFSPPHPPPSYSAFLPVILLYSPFHSSLSLLQRSPLIYSLPFPTPTPPTLPLHLIHPQSTASCYPPPSTNKASKAVVFIWVP